MTREDLKKIETAIKLLERLSEDASVPRNIRRVASESLEIIYDEDPEMSIAVKASNVIENLEELTYEHNCPSHARQILFDIIVELEIS